MKLVLFDIDGTLLLTNGAGRRAIHRALTDIFGSTGPADYHFDGKTDPQIVRELMRLAGHEDEQIDAKMHRTLNLYLENLQYELNSPEPKPYTLPGVTQLLDALEARSDVILGLLTGNIERGARAKLDAVGIDFSRFRVGAFGSDHERRPSLPGIARERAKRQAGSLLNGGDIVVIGDTPDDLTCGRTLGAAAIGVATGRYSVAQLMEHSPVAAFEDLSDTTAVMSAIVG